jgi:hypothetical protein
MAKYHPNKEINAAIEHAISNGWRFEKAGPRAHVYGVLYCALANRSGCRHNVHGTPRVPEDHADRIYKRVKDCTCQERSA